MSKLHLFEYFLYGSIFLCGCSSPKIYSHTNYEQAINLNFNDTTISLSIFDTINIDATSTSLQGEWIIIDDKLIYLDKNLVSIRKYNRNGEFVEKVLNRGRGPQEFLNPPLCFLKLTNSNYLYITRDSDFYILDSVYNQKLKMNLIIKASENDNMSELYDHPNPNKISMYEMEIGDNQMVEFGDNIVFPITTEHIKYNGFYKENNAADFYKHSFTLLALNKNTFNYHKVFANFPSIYWNKMIPNFKSCSICADDSVLFVSYQADPNIYTYNKNLELFGYFGKSSEMINTDLYPETTNFNDAEKNYKKHHKEYGYYSEIKQIQKYLFRSYHTTDGKNGLQIYYKYGLIHNSILPYDLFDMIGYIEPYFYAVTKCDIENERYSIIRFKI